MSENKDDPQNMKTNISEDAQMGTVADVELDKDEPEGSDDVPPPLVREEEVPGGTPAAEGDEK
jgi:hypothetical protein